MQASAVEVFGVVLMVLGVSGLTWGGYLVAPALGFAVLGLFLLVAGVALAYIAAVRSGGEGS